MNLNYIKKRTALFTGACMLATAALAQEAHLYIPDFTVSNYEPVTVDIMLDNDVEITAYSFNIELPEGLEIVPGSVQKTSRFNQSQTIGYRNNTFMVSSMQNLPFTGNEGSVGTFKIKAVPGALSIEETTGTINLYNIDLATIDPENSFQGLESETTVTMVDTTDPVNLTLSVTPEATILNPGGVLNVAVAMDNDKPIEGLQLEIELPEGFTFQETNGVIFNQTSRMDGGATITPMTIDGITRVGIVNIMDNLVLSEGSGDFMTFSIVAPEDFSAEEVEVVINNIQASVNFRTYIVEPVTIAVTNGVIAYNNAQAEVEALETALATALATIEEECPDVKDQFDGAEITVQIEDLKGAIEAAYNDGSLTPNYEEVMAPVSEINTAIETLVNDAKAAQQEFVDEGARSEALTAATEVVTGLREALEEALTTIAETCPDVMDQYNGEAIEEQIANLETAIQEAYENKTIVEDYEALVAPAEDIQAAIDQLVIDAQAAQAAHEAGEALETARQNANTVLNSLDQALADALAQINEECPDVKHLFPGTYIQQQITVLRNAVNEAYENGTLAENYDEIIAPATEIENSIAQMIADAKAAQQEIDDAETARQEANAEAYAADLAAIEDLREELENARINIQENYPAYNYAEKYLDILDAINTEKANADSEYESVAESGTYSYEVDVIGIQTMIAEMLDEAADFYTGVEMLKANELNDGDQIFTLDGHKVSHLQPGQLNLIIKTDGTCQKVLVK